MSSAKQNPIQDYTTIVRSKLLNIAEWIKTVFAKKTEDEYFVLDQIRIDRLTIEPFDTTMSATFAHINPYEYHSTKAVDI